MRRLWAILSAIALPLPLLAACGGGLSTEAAIALAPLGAACSGGQVPDAADYDPNNAQPKTVAIVSESGNITANNRYLGSGINQGTKIQDAQLVLCIDLAEPRTLETCRYSGPQSFEVQRLDRSAKVKLVTAKTGQVLEQVDLTAEAIPCPPSITTREGSTPSQGPYTADANLSNVIRDWSMAAIAGAQPQATAAAASPSPQAIATPSPAATKTPSSNPPSGQGGTPKAQCEALHAATKSPFGYGFAAKLEAESGLIKPDSADYMLRAASQLGTQGMQRHLPAAAAAIALMEQVSVQTPELQTMRDGFLGELRAMEQTLQQFNGLVGQAATIIGPRAGVPIDRTKLQPIATKMVPLAETLDTQSKNLEAMQSKIFSYCLSAT